MKTRLELHVCSLLVNSQKAVHPACWKLYNIYQYFVLWCSARVVWLSHYPGLHNLSLYNLNTATMTKSQQDWHKDDCEGGYLGCMASCECRHVFQVIVFLGKETARNTMYICICNLLFWRLAFSLSVKLYVNKVSNKWFINRVQMQGEININAREK